MRANTLHTLTEWKQIAGELPIKVLKRGGLVQSQEYIDSHEQYLRKEKATFAIYIQASQRTTRQGILLDIIQSDAPFEIIDHALAYYRGFRSGFNTMVRMVERENKRLFKECPPEISDGPFYWSMIGKTNIRGLVEVFGWMQTEKSHECLMHLANSEMHPRVRAAAIDAMAFEGDKFDAKYILELVNNPETPLHMAFNALYCLLYNNGRYKVGDYCHAIWPFVLHDDHNVWGGAIDALAQKYRGRQMLREHLAILNSDPDVNLSKIKRIHTNIHWWEEDDALTTKKLRKRTNDKL